MLGYYRNPEATEEAFRGGWFHSGDLAVMHPDGYIEVRDRGKDIVISGGENISSIEVEKALYDHPAVWEVAIIAYPDEKWGEVPKAYVLLKPGQTATEQELIEFSRERLAHFKCPKLVEFGPLPKTATGKIRKAELRERVWAGTGEAGELMPYQDLIVEREEGVGVITLNRPTRRNALSLGLMTELIACLEEMGQDRTIRAVILAAAGPAFCSGHDLSETVGRDINENRRLFDVCTVLMEKLQSIPQPVIAEVQGIATAAGCQLVASCDLAIASANASFATPGVRIGLFCTTPMVALTRAIGRKRAMEMLLTGQAVSAETAAEWGLVNRTVAAENLKSETRKLACAHRRSERCDGGYRQAGVLYADRPGPAQSVQLRQRGDEYEPDGSRCAGGDYGVSREAAGVLEGEVKKAVSEKAVSYQLSAISLRPVRYFLAATSIRVTPAANATPLKRGEIEIIFSCFTLIWASPLPCGRSLLLV